MTRSNQQVRFEYAGETVQARVIERDCGLQGIQQGFWWCEITSAKAPRLVGLRTSVPETRFAA